MVWHVAFFSGIHYLTDLAQTPAPPPLTSAEVIDLLRQSNEDLSNSFNQFLDLMKFLLVALGALAGVATYIFGKSLGDARKVAADIVQQEVERKIATQVKDAVEDEIDSVRRLIGRERIISDITVDYFVPGSDALPPAEATFLKTRGFKRVSYWNETDLVDLSGQVVVLDLVNAPILSVQMLADLSEDEAHDRREKSVIDNATRLLGRMGDRAVLVIYIRPAKRRVAAIDDLSAQIAYYAAANTPVNLIGVVADAGYVAHGWRRLVS